MSDNRNRPNKPLSSPISKSSASAKASFRKRSETAPTFDDIPAQKLHALICACTTSNASPTFSYTRDGSAIVVAIYYRDTRYVDYLSGEGEFDEYTKWVLGDLLNLSDKEQSDYLQARF